MTSHSFVPGDPGPLTLHVSGPGWFTSAIQGIRDGRQHVRIIVTGYDAEAIVSRIHRVTERLASLGVLKQLPVLAPAAKAFEVGAAAPAVLASIGAIGAAASLVAVAAGAGVASGYRMSFTVNLANVLDPEDDELFVDLTKG